MLFKSHPAALVLLLCGLHLIGSTESQKGANTTHLTSKDNKLQTSSDKTAPDSQPTSITQQTMDKDMVTSAIQPTNMVKTDKTTAKKTTQLAEKEKTESERQILTHTPASQPTSITQHVATSNSQVNKSLITREQTKNFNGSVSSTHKGGSSATIPSLFTIASLMCVFLL